MAILSYTNIFDSQWSDEKLMKYSIITFTSIFLSVFGGFGALTFYNASKVLAWLAIAPNSVIGGLIFGLTIVQMFAWFVVLQAIHRKKFGYFFKIKGDKYPIRKIAFISFVFGGLLIGLPELVDAIFKLVGYVPPANNPMVGKIMVSFPILSIVFFTAVGMTEEIFFRGVLQTGFSKLKVFNLPSLPQNFGAFAGIFISSIIFTAMHGAQYSYVTLIQLMGMSVLLGYIYFKYKNIFINMFAHGMNNLFSVALVTIPLFIAPTAGLTDTGVMLEESNLITQITAQSTKGLEPLEIKYDPNLAFMRHCSLSYDKVINIKMNAVQSADTEKTSSMEAFYSNKAKRLRDGFSQSCDLVALKADLEKLYGETDTIYNLEQKDKSLALRMKSKIEDELDMFK